MLKYILMEKVKFKIYRFNIIYIILLSPRRDIAFSFLCICIIQLVLACIYLAYIFFKFLLKSKQNCLNKLQSSKLECIIKNVYI